MDNCVSKDRPSKAPAARDARSKSCILPVSRANVRRSQVELTCPARPPDQTPAGGSVPLERPFKTARPGSRGGPFSSHSRPMLLSCSQSRGGQCRRSTREPSPSPDSSAHSCFSAQAVKTKAEQQIHPICRPLMQAPPSRRSTDGSIPRRLTLLQWTQRPMPRRLTQRPCPTRWSARRPPGW